MARTATKTSKNPKKTAAVGDLFAGMEQPSGRRAAGKAARGP
jgi:hypothetical protein